MVNTSRWMQKAKNAMWDPTSHKEILMSAAKATNRTSEILNQN